MAQKDRVRMEFPNGLKIDVHRTIWNSHFRRAEKTAKDRDWNRFIRDRVRQALKYSLA